MRFQGTKKLPTEGQDLNALVANTVKEVIKQKKCAEATAEHDYGMEKEPEKFNSKSLSTEKNEKTPAVIGKVKRKCEEKAQRQDKD